MKNVGSAWKTNTWHCLKDFLINHVHSHIHAAVYKGKKLSGMKISSELFRYLSIGLHWLSYLPYACVYNLSKYYFSTHFIIVFTISDLRNVFSEYFSRIWIICQRHFIVICYALLIMWHTHESKKKPSPQIGFSLSILSGELFVPLFPCIYYAYYICLRMLTAKMVKQNVFAVIRLVFHKIFFHFVCCCL